MDINILQGDCIESLKKLEDQCINTCITSPPYWGLRDYGTAEWDGGDINCDHVANPNATKKMGNEEFNKNRPSRESTKTKGYYEKECPKCGAVRKDSQLGLEETPDEFANNLVKVFREIKRVLRNDGTVWLNLGDSYSSGGRTTTTNQSLRGDKDYGVTRPKPSKGIKPKDLIGIPWRVAFALQQDGWYLRQDIIWHKPNPMPESVKDRCTKAHEYIFLLSKSPKYYFDNESIKEDAKYPQGPNSPQSIKKGKGEFGMDTRGGLSNIGAIAKKNKRSVWTVTTKPFKGAHFATFPKDLIEPCVLAGCPEGGTVLDPFGGSGTTGIVAAQHNRNAVLLELNREYIDLAKQRINKELGMMANLKCEKEKI
jgi:site-specific DNA-methyltransferase (adenine-specific)